MGQRDTKLPVPYDKDRKPPLLGPWQTTPGESSIDSLPRTVQDIVMRGASPVPRGRRGFKGGENVGGGGEVLDTMEGAQ